ncbi:hypothetical protein [Aurantimonas sp. Leaf443]|uniref:hypothetical protein n=1 Tax=Aurantimonas sp. Leaf443 TaxID=1736378 RepID=UPI0006F87F68|nr:hypothetical protein [Aurantimonas sp. Leaf443]KQT88290.1 hypothetical protein ASG48_02360 [Aurantimonas sp. Leaf443]
MPTLRSTARVTLLSALILSSWAGGAHAFSQFGGKDNETVPREGILQVPLPPLTGSGAAPTSEAEETPAADPAAPAGTLPPVPAEAAPAQGPDQPQRTPPASIRDLTGAAPEPEQAEDEAAAQASAPAEIFYGSDGLPGPVVALRDKLMEIARTGEIEALKPYLRTGEEGTVLSFGETPEDPIAFLKSISGDGEGVETLAILLEVLEAGHTVAEKGTPDEIFVWPYFTQVSLETLTNRQKVELFKIVTAGDYEAMKEFGAYNFYRVGLSPDGKLEFFVAGD